MILKCPRLRLSDSVVLGDVLTSSGILHRPTIRKMVDFFNEWSYSTQWSVHLAVAFCQRGFIKVGVAHGI